MARQQIVDYPVITGSNMQRSAAFDSSYAYNWYPFYDTVRKQQAQYMYAGSKKVLDFNVGGNSYKGRPKNIAATEDLAFFVIGDIVFEYDGTSATNIGTIGTTTGPLKMEIVGKYLTIVDGTGIYTYDIVTGTFDDGPFTNAPTSPTYICEQQGYALLNDADTQTMFQAAQYNTKKYSSFNRIQINYKSSYLSYPLIAQESINGRVLAFTTGFIETLENEGKAGFTFRPDLNLTYGYGLISPTALAKGTGGAQGEAQPEFLIFVCRNPDGTIKVMQTHGNPPVSISTPSIEYRLAQLTQPQEGVAFIHTQNGQTFWQCSWTTDNLTLVYNMTNKTWFDAGYRGGRHFAESFIFFKGKRLVTSYLDNGLYEFSENYITNDGEPITREIITSNMRIDGYKRFTGNMFEMYFQQGVGLPGRVIADMPNYVYGASAMIFVSVSYNGGISFEEPVEVSLGELAHYVHVTRVTSLGTPRDVTFRIVCKQPIATYLLGAMFTFTPNEGTQ